MGWHPAVEPVAPGAAVKLTSRVPPSGASTSISSSSIVKVCQKQVVVGQHHRHLTLGAISAVVE
jgi:hypothetical protein